MSQITPYNFLEGMPAIDIPSNLYASFYDIDGNSLEVINGGLDASNLAKNARIDYTEVQRGAVSGGGQVAATANLDYFSGAAGDTPLGSGFFAGVPDDPTTRYGRYIPIPGAAISFYLPFDAYVLLTWSITWTNDCDSGNEDQTPTDDPFTDITLFVDGNANLAFSSISTARLTPFARRVRRTCFGEDENTANNKKILQDRYKSRVWSGHALFGDNQVMSALPAGHHTASLRLGQAASIKQGRVRARSMKYIYFKKGDT